MKIEFEQHRQGGWRVLKTLPMPQVPATGDRVVLSGEVFTITQVTWYPEHKSIAATVRMWAE